MCTGLGKQEFKPIKAAVVEYMQSIKINSLSNICNNGLSDLSNTAYTVHTATGASVSAYISGKLQVSMLQLYSNVPLV